MFFCNWSGSAAESSCFRFSKMSSAPADVIEIKPKIEYLSAEELIAQRHAEAETPYNGLKRTSIECSAAEQEELKNAYANMRRQLSARRIERQAGRAVAIWRQDQQAVEVMRKDGKFESFGYSQQGKFYLEYYEALFLLELNRLQLEFCDMIVSVEQAYVLLLGEAASDKYNNYLVYSALSRAGYIVIKHQAACPAAQTTSTSLATSEDCIWALLEEALGNRPVSAHIKASVFYNGTQARMAELKQQIISQTSASTDENSMESDLQSNFKFETRKRKAQSEPQEEEASDLYQISANLRKIGYSADARRRLRQRYRCNIAQF
ncbi:tRNA-splicing endonuclease subunit Sen54 isoform X2 [Drosophila montana]|uniref:tRNA-splicing endonuclease subunit Sen54 isoform X2 n=1 Tax=Drosophila montana TaxID=40370 RepID=UPI00313C7EAF